MREEIYPVYNHKNRPPIGENHFKKKYFSCFTVSLQIDEYGNYLPFTFLDFINQLQEYKDYHGVCSNCVNHNRIFKFPAYTESVFIDSAGDEDEHVEVDRSAVLKKFSHREDEVDESDYYYCRLVREILDQSYLHATPVPYKDREELPADPIPSILFGNYDEQYLFELKKVSPPTRLKFCDIYNLLTSDKFIISVAERSFFILWFLSMYKLMDNFSRGNNALYFEDDDFGYLRSKLFRWTFPIPQVWVNVISPPPPGISWKEWRSLHGQEELPQRVDFLFTYQGKRHVVEIDDSSHYRTEKNYRRTLNDTRWLRYCGYEVHRFSISELLELCNPQPKSAKWPGEMDLDRFIFLLEAEGLRPEKMMLF